MKTLEEISCDFLIDKKQKAIEHMSLMLLAEKQFLRLASDTTKGMAYSGHRNINYEDYYRFKTNVYLCDLWVKSLKNGVSLQSLFLGIQRTIESRVRYPYQSTCPVRNHEELVENSVRQELVDELKNLVSDDSPKQKTINEGVNT